MTQEAQQTNTTSTMNGAQNGTQTAVQNAQAQTQTEMPENFDKWISQQPEAIRNLFDAHIDGLKSAVDVERTRHKDLEKQLRNLSKQATDGSDLKTQLEKLATDAQQAESKAAFFADAHEAGVKNLKLAWAAVKEYDAYDKHGNIDFGKLKVSAPELFATTTTSKVPPANAGAGANQSGAAKPDMNTFLRAAAGRG